jgi:predicted dienelactone hydrolase
VLQHVTKANAMPRFEHALRRPDAGSRTVRVAVLLVALTVVASCSGSSGSTTGTSTSAPTGRVRLIAAGGLRGLLDRERARHRSESSTTTSTTLPSAPFLVAQLTTTFVDPSRGTPARDGTGATSSRTIKTTIWYPASAQPTSGVPTPAAAAGRHPLVVFAHGYEIDAAAYTPLLRDIAVGGYVVAAPDFPGTSTAYPGGAVRLDSLEQPADISFVITSMLGLAGQPGPLANAIDPEAIGVSGQSDGAVTALAAGWNTCCRDARIKAGAIYTGATFAFEGEWFSPGTPPTLFVHARADEINPYDASVSMFQRAQSPKYLLTIEDGSHLEVYIDPPWEPQVAAATIAFFDQYLKHDASAAARLDTAGNQPGLTTLQKG